jgi:hypothetical protein
LFLWLALDPPLTTRNEWVTYAWRWVLLALTQPVVAWLFFFAFFTAPLPFSRGARSRRRVEPWLLATWFTVASDAALPIALLI